MSYMVHVVLVYQREAGRLLVEETYDDLHTAMRRRFALERVPEYSDMEIVVLTADSAEMLRETHGRYFFTATELVERLRETLRAAA